MAATNKPSVADRTRPIAAGAAVVGAYFLADTAVFVLGDGERRRTYRDGRRRRQGRGHQGRYGDGDDCRRSQASLDRSRGPRPGWYGRLVGGKHMRMSGYAAKVRTMAWTAGGKGLATSGAPQLIVWPFHGKDGPMGKEPLMLAPAEHQVSTVACHPQKDVIAA